MGFMGIFFSARDERALIYGCFYVFVKSDGETPQHEKKE
jgi:hypothetical protein